MIKLKVSKKQYIQGHSTDAFILAKTASLPTPEGPERTISNGLDGGLYGA